MNYEEADGIRLLPNEDGEDGYGSDWEREGEGEGEAGEAAADAEEGAAGSGDGEDTFSELSDPGGTEVRCQGMCGAAFEPGFIEPRPSHTCMRNPWVLNP